MKQKRNYTLTEQEENKIVNQIYNTLIPQHFDLTLFISS